VLEASASELNGTLEGLVGSLSDSLKWEWDDRFGGVLAAFEVADKNRVFGVIDTQFSQAWDSASISDAPDSVSGALQNFGGLTTNQLLFTSDLTQDVILLALWWPWGDGTTISIRLVPYGLDTSDGEKEEVQAALKEAFGL
jgi:hypothetical protein